MSKTAIKNAYAVYTGGNIWLFYGELQNGNYFLTDDFGATRILSADPADLDESLYEDWQQEHLVKDLVGNDRTDFCEDLIDWLKNADEENKGGITEDELDGYRSYFQEEI